MDEGSVPDVMDLPPTSEMFEARQFAKLGRVLFDTEQDEFMADAELLATPDFPESLKMLFAEPQFHCLRIEALVHRPDGTFLLVYRASRKANEQADKDQAVEAWPVAAPEWGFCTVSPRAFYHIDIWFDRRDLQIRRAKALVENGLDDEGVTSKRLAALQARKIDPDSVRFETAALLIKHGLDNDQVTERRIACLTQNGLDRDSIEKARAKIIDEMCLGAEDIARRVQRELRSSGLDDEGVARLRDTFLRENGLA